LKSKGGKKFQVGDTVGYSKGNPTTYKIMGITKDSYIMDTYYKGKFVSMFGADGRCGASAVESQLELFYRKVKATDLAKRIYPDAVEVNGYLEVRYV